MFYQFCKIIYKKISFFSSSTPTSSSSEAECRVLWIISEIVLSLSNMGSNKIVWLCPHPQLYINTHSALVGMWNKLWQLRNTRTKNQSKQKIWEQKLRKYLYMILYWRKRRRCTALLSRSITVSGSLLYDLSLMTSPQELLYNYIC